MATWVSLLIPASSSSPSPSSNSAAAHQNEGFLKSVWHSLTHQHDHLKDDKPRDAKPEEGGKAAEEEPKKASGSG